MSKKAISIEAPIANEKLVKAFTLVQRDGGFVVVEILFDSQGKIKSTNEIHGPDVLQISLAILATNVRKAVGL